MTLKWLGPGYFGKDVAPGDDMPKIDKGRLDKFIKLGKVGSIAEKIDLDKIKSNLKAENAELNRRLDAAKINIDAADAENEEIYGRLDEVKAAIEALDAENAELNKRLDVVKAGIDASDAENAELNKRLDASDAENTDLKKTVPHLKGENTKLKTKLAAIEKELADLVAAAAKGGK